VRITGGRSGGRLLAAPADARVRPTSDKVRQAVFNVLTHNDFCLGFSLEGARVVDLFAGTGAMGLEALSRGAGFCLFIDDSAESRALLRQNVETLALTGSTKIWRLDPPYRMNLIAPALASLRDGQWLAQDALVVAECAREESLNEQPGFSRLDSRNYGKTQIVFSKVNAQE
jgi:16S rRNA (guanine966-N2)-methyltransferase